MKHWLLLSLLFFFLFYDFHISRKISLHLRVKFKPNRSLRKKKDDREKNNLCETNVKGSSFGKLRSYFGHIFVVAIVDVTKFPSIYIFDEQWIIIAIVRTRTTNFVQKKIIGHNRLRFHCCYAGNFIIPILNTHQMLKKKIKEKKIIHFFFEYILKPKWKLNTKTRDTFCRLIQSLALE